MTGEAFGPWIGRRRTVRCWGAAFGLGLLTRRFVSMPPSLERAAVPAVLAPPLALQLWTWTRNRRTRQRWRRQARPQWTPRGQVDVHLDTLLRHGLAAAFSQDHTLLAETVDAINAQGLDTTRQLRDLLVAVNAMALHAVSDGTWPGYRELKAIAEEFATARPMFEIPDLQLGLFFTGLPKPRPTSLVFFSSHTLFIGFAVAGWLLDDVPRPAGMTRWQFLQEIENALKTGAGRLARVRLV
ncbi:hypothetical protein GCM10022223_31360 [Kineosporia mesophila]|uniref:Uncharacterized protein n=1 Tax=Kineosporia mesophila TaxID=566012 RepID=A0ABP6ZL79_9ACTN|nr:hypothetical protein [Kineosporia mesophila]MCD5349453.1 hypothetical protein [Kineosporia mesophila]